MSNCIDLRNNVVTFPASVIDVVKVRDLLTQVPDKMPDSEKEPILSAAWWFLSTCTTVTNENVTIRFGCGRSSHCWRDFIYLANNVILPLFREGQTFTHHFQVEDEGFPGWVTWKVTFGREVK